MTYNKKTIAALGSILVLVAMFGYARAQNRRTISSQLDFGARGDDVIALQTLLASNRLIYPEGIVSGYFGPLTQRAVTQFQVNYGIIPAGRVGPITLAKLNNFISSGITVLDISAPGISNISVATSSSSAVIRWNTDEAARSKIYYQTSIFAMGEVSAPMTEPAISGAVVSDEGFATQHELTLTGLTPNTSYFYVIQAKDNAGNVSVTWPVAFRTTQ